jgi:PncC family amidohydrolase
VAKCVLVDEDETQIADLLRHNVRLAALIMTGETETQRLTDSEGSEIQSRELAAQAGELLFARHLTLGLAESCTGGLVASRITDIAGSSNYFLGSVVSYAYSAKEATLGVRHETLLAHGAVSPECAAEMAWGARRAFRSDIAIGITGIAGPTGGSPGKPVGLVYMHLSADDAEIGEQHVWDRDRVGNKELSAKAALQLLHRYLTRARPSAQDT